ncbi:ADP-ribose pyrophosphatase, mitochondrial-like [Stegodyphus dumicola]|uniref:ADP-ribose pyrophosphatase, mitochondrial-like n=1 Tax=Stegodyphus dumicola TaxID=202533 RepID=UPI0015AC971F|nr:ADP-ribose pyrophosphatase, mitochondrial-like [Stegodyphus dumicola]
MKTDLNLCFRLSLSSVILNIAGDPGLFSAGKMNSICRISTCYPVLRFLLSDEKVPWHVAFPDYSPPNYSAPHLLKSSWADPDINDEKFQPKWNQEDGEIDRQSFDQNKQIKYDVVNGYPLNPKGRTGLSGRGRLGRWGPNHAVDAVVTR